MAFSSMVSLLDNIDEKINISIIHNTKNLQQQIPLYIRDHKNLGSVAIYQFLENNDNFPNIEKSHISEATYYRLFLENYIKDETGYFIYLDADVICLKNPIEYFKSIFQQMKNNDLCIAAMNHLEVPKVDQRSINLGIKSGKYFNAGVMVIDILKWRNLKVKEKSVEIIRQKNKDLMLWDQDVLNIIFDGKSQNINLNFNYRMDLLNFNEQEKKSIDEEVYLLHYFGKSKPWSLKGINFGVAEYYQEQFRKIYSNKYHIVHNWKKGSLLYLFEVIFTGKIFKTKHPFRLIYESLKSLIK
tara:strand:- start:31951 stop:32847 length:897 start_codon:yes stop_codon:yes gene_type:complete